jgi:hypothetical protein
VKAAVIDSPGAVAAARTWKPPNRVLSGTAENSGVQQAALTALPGPAQQALCLPLTRDLAPGLTGTFVPNPRRIAVQR